MAKSSAISILTTGTETYAAMLSDIRGAKTSIIYANFCFMPGQIFDRLSAELITSAKRGVQVRIVADWYGSSSVDEKRIQKLQKAGVEWVWFRPKRLHQILSYNRRMHKKLLIIDNRIAYTGGFGIADFWEWPRQGYPKAWRDTHFRITDPGAVAALYNAAVASWNKFSRYALEPASAPATKLLVVDSAPHRWLSPSPAGRLQIRALQHARSNVRITTAYFGPSRILRDAIVQAAQRGVTVELLLNGAYASHQVAWMAGQHHYETLLRVGVKIYEYQATKMHAKLMTIDDKIAVIGSANWNFRSLYHDQECNVLIRDRDICSQLNHQFKNDLKQSIQITEVNETQRLKQRISSLGRYFF